MDTHKQQLLDDASCADLIPLEIPFPPRLARAFGYPGKARFVGFWWEPTEDEVVYDDGLLSGTGDPWAFLVYRQHPTVAPHLDPYQLGYSDLETEHALLVDCKNDRIWVAGLGVVQAFLRRQHGLFLAFDDPQALEDAVEGVIDATAEEIDPDDVKVLQAQRRTVARLLAFLDQSASL